jgi:hypothetical protein
MFGGKDAVDVVLAKRFQSVKAFNVWKQSSAGQKLLRKYTDLKAKKLEDGSVIVWNDTNKDEQFDGNEELIARNGYTIKRTPTGKKGVAKPRYEKRIQRSEWIADNGGGVKACKKAQPIKPQSAYTIILQLVGAVRRQSEELQQTSLMFVAKSYHDILKEEVLRALYSKFADVRRDEKWDKKLIGSPEFKILCIVGMPTPRALYDAFLQQQSNINTEAIATWTSDVIADPQQCAVLAARSVSEYGLSEQMLLSEIAAGWGQGGAAQLRESGGVRAPIEEREPLRVSDQEAQEALNFLRQVEAEAERAQEAPPRLALRGPAPERGLAVRESGRRVRGEIDVDSGDEGQ